MSCQGHVRVMSGSYQGHVRVMSGLCQGHIRVMSESCQGHVRVMSDFLVIFEAETGFSVLFLFKVGFLSLKKNFFQEYVI